jgi:hypothetical protein
LRRTRAEAAPQFSTVMFCYHAENDTTNLASQPGERGRRMYEKPFGILSFSFSGENGKWLESAANLDDAEQQMRQLAAQQPGVYFIFNCWDGCIVSQVDTQASVNVQTKALLEVRKPKVKTTSAP